MTLPEAVAVGDAERVESYARAVIREDRLVQERECMGEVWGGEGGGFLEVGG